MNEEARKRIEERRKNKQTEDEPKLNEQQVQAIKTFYDLLGHKKETELRAFELSKDFKTSTCKEQRFVHSLEEFIEFCEKFDGKYNLYAGLNERIENGTKAKDVISVKNIFVDIDCKMKPASSNDMTEALRITNKIISGIKDKTGGEPTIIMSGNGYQLLYSIPEIIITNDNREKIETQIEQFTKDLINLYSNQYIKLDNVGDLPRIIRITGTTNIKGGNISNFIEVHKEEKSKLRDYILNLDIKEQFSSEDLTEPTEQKQQDTSRSGKEFQIILRLLKKGKTRSEIYEEMKLYSKWCSSPEAYKTLTYEKAEDLFLKWEDEKENQPADYKTLTRREQIETFWEKQPFYYDKSKIFWLWDKENKKWILSDEIDFLNHIQEVLGSETIDSKTRNEFIEGFKQIGRKHKPKEIEKSWVQFKNKIYDIKTGESFEASPKYFITNPIPWNIGETEETPSIDKLIKDWVEEKDRPSLYEIIAYSLCLDKFMQRIFAFVGGGSNGKGTYIKLLIKFLGKENVIASDLKSLSENRFETACLYKKLLCVMGEVSFDDLKNTNNLKKLAGEDQLSFEFKGKQPFTAENTATCICLTNSLPITSDKTIGFYRKWLIRDFTKQFPKLDNDLIEEIPEIEFENLARKCLRILKELYEKKEFTNEGDFDDRARRYEERSNPVMRFVEKWCDEEVGEWTTIRDFTNSCNGYLRSMHLRVLTARQIGTILRENGFIVGNRKIGNKEEEISAVVILNLKCNWEIQKKIE